MTTKDLRIAAICLCVPLLLGLAGTEAGADKEFTHYPSTAYRVSNASHAPDQRGKVKAKKKENSDAVGWLVVPGTAIDSVVVQNPYNEGNEYYLGHNFEKKRDKQGTYCADRRAAFGSGTRAELSRNTVLYAHNFDDDPNGILFAQLKRFKDPAFAKENPYIFFSTNTENMVWEIFAVYDTTVHFPYVWPDLTDATMNKVLGYVYEASIYDYGIKVSNADKILTLSTCTFSVNDNIQLSTQLENQYRFVIMARLVSPDAALKSEAGFTVNESPLSAKAMPGYYG